jgi:hypothetical protein
VSHYGTAERTAQCYCCSYYSCNTQYNKQVINDVTWDIITNAELRVTSDFRSLSYHTALQSNYVTAPHPTSPDYYVLIIQKLFAAMSFI